MDISAGRKGTGCRTLTKLQFDDKLDVFTEEEQELETLVESSDKTYARNKLEKSVMMTKPIRLKGTSR